MERYKVSESGIITDTQTGLDWYVGSDKNITWDEARQWVFAVRSNSSGE